MSTMQRESPAHSSYRKEEKMGKRWDYCWNLRHPSPVERCQHQILQGIGLTAPLSISWKERQRASPVPGARGIARRMKQGWRTGRSRGMFSRQAGSAWKSLGRNLRDALLLKTFPQSLLLLYPVRAEALKPECLYTRITLGYLLLSDCSVLPLEILNHHISTGAQKYAF